MTLKATEGRNDICAPEFIRKAVPDFSGQGTAFLLFKER